jgi:hypothetical protein
MLRNLGLTATLTLTIAGVARGQTPLPKAPESEQPLCYFQTADGTVINLDNLCAQSVQKNTNLKQSNANSVDQPHRFHHYAEFRTRELRGEY